MQYPSLDQCGFKARGSSSEEEAILAIEQSIGVSLPSAYRAFLLATAGGTLDGWAACEEPTPFGDSGITHFYSAKDVQRYLTSAIVPRNMVCIGGGHLGSFVCISIAGLDHGSVYALDSDMRHFWGPEKLARFTQLAPNIKEYFRLRDAQELPRKPWGYDNCYRICGNFEEYLLKLSPSEE
jgi:hypothetical protein